MNRRSKTARLLTGGLVGASTAPLPGDEHWDDVTLLLDGSTASLTTDASTAGNDPTNSNVTSTTATITGWSVASDVFEFNSSTDSLTLPSNFAPDFGTDDFTIELWYQTDLITGSGHVIFDTRQESVADGWRLARSNQTLGLADNFNTHITTGNVITSTSTWYHIAMVRSGATVTIYVDGSSAGSFDATAAGKSFDTGDPLTIGRKPFESSGVLAHDGQMAHIRFTQGVARYTGPFTPPTASLPTNAPVVGRRGVGSVPTALAVDTFATLDPTTVPSGTTLSNGNLTADFGATNGFAISTQTMSSGKYYFEVRCDVSSVYLGAMMVGVCDASGNQLSTFYGYDGTKRPPAGPYGTSISNGDVVGVALDADSGTTWFTDGSGNWQNNATAAGIAAGSDTNYAHTSLNHPFTFGVSDASSGDIDIEVTCNFGQDATFNGTESAGTYTDANGLGEFQYEPPAGFVGLYTTTEVAPTVPTLRTRGYIGAAPAEGRGMLTLYDRYIDGLVVKPDGLTAATAGYSAAQILADYPGSTDGIYYIKDGAGTKQVYCDMTNGGWMLYSSFASTNSLDATNYPAWNGNRIVHTQLGTYGYAGIGAGILNYSDGNTNFPGTGYTHLTGYYGCYHYSTSGAQDGGVGATTWNGPSDVSELRIGWGQGGGGLTGTCFLDINGSQVASMSSATPLVSTYSFNPSGASHYFGVRENGIVGISFVYMR